MSFWDDLKAAYQKEIGVSQDESSAAMFKAREAQELSPQAPRGEQLLGTYRTGQAIKAALGYKEDPFFQKERELLDIGFSVDTPGERVGTIAGAIQSDLVQDSTRRFYWLLNAAQATGDVIAEQFIKSQRPDLYSTFKKDVMEVDRTTGELVPGKRDTRRYGGGLVQMVAAPAGIAINTGLGLMTPFGGAEGYKAALPSEADPTKTSNVLGEIAAKYLLGRTGDLLPYNEFVKVRPDVSKEEYNRYKAFKFDKRGDINPFDDGKVGIPLGVLKATTEGIHGPEIQFLGRSIPLTTGIVPFAAATAGAGLGARWGGDKPIRRGVYGGLGGLLAGNVVGNVIEGERRRRNAAENARDTL